MKKIFKLLFLCLMLFPIITFAGEKKVNMYLFYGKGCPHCSALGDYLKEYKEENTNIAIFSYETWYNSKNAENLKEVQKIIGNESNGVPYLVIGNNAIIGYNEESTPETIRNMVNYYMNVDYVDKVGIYLGVVEDEGKVETEHYYYESNKDKNETINNDKNETKSDKTIDDLNASNWLKNVIKTSPLFISSMVIGFVDGINICAMWILLFLISMLLTLKNKKRRWIIGLSFLISSGLVYFLFLISALKLNEFLDKIVYVRVGIAFISVCLGTYSILKYLKNLHNNSCEVVNTKGRERIIKEITNIVKEKSFPLAIIGIVVLAASVNLIELMCSLGLPVMFSELLVINDVNNTGKILYSLVYVLFFLIDDIIIFIIAMKTLEIKALSNKFGNTMHLVGGIIMIIIGLLMLIKPEWLMFNF